MARGSCVIGRFLNAPANGFQLSSVCPRNINHVGAASRVEKYGVLAVP